MAVSPYDRVLDSIARWGLGPIAGAIDLLRPSLARGFGGPFNGQQRRLDAVREIFARLTFEAIVETGTYRGTTTRLLRRLSPVPIATIEASSRYYHYSRAILRKLDITVMRGDSAEVLRSLATRPPWNRTPTFFYLDAHWHDALPLTDELLAIVNGWDSFVVLVDDFRVPGDPGYGYDDYGPGRVLESALLAPLAGSPVAVYWPLAHSDTETGARRGWIVLASAGPIDDSLRSVRTLRRAGSVDAVAATARQ